MNPSEMTVDHLARACIEHRVKKRVIAGADIVTMPKLIRQETAEVFEIVTRMVHELYEIK